MALNSRLKPHTKPLYMPWSEEEFIADVYVRGMTPVQRWMFRTLLQNMFSHTTRPYLPNDDEILWVLAGCESQKQWMDNKAKVIARFSAVKDNPELLENKRVVADWKNLSERRKQFSKMGQNSAKVRSTQVKPTLRTRSTESQQEKVREGKRREEKGSSSSSSSDLHEEV